MIAIDTAKYYLGGGVANRSKQLLLFSNQRTEIREIERIVAILAMPDVCESLTPVSDNPNGITLEQLSKELLEALGYEPDNPMAFYDRKVIQDYFLKHYR